MLDTKQGEEREMDNVPPEFVEDMNKDYHGSRNLGHMCELEHECVCIPNVIVNESWEQFFSVIFDKRVLEIITCIHSNLEKKHEDASLVVYYHESAAKETSKGNRKRKVPSKITRSYV